MGIKESGGIYMRVDVQIALGGDLHSCHGGIGRAEWVHEAVIAERVLFLLGGLR